VTIQIAAATRNAAADAVVDRTDVGTTNAQGRLRLYSGSKPASANTGATGTLLAEVNLANPAFGAASSGVATLLGVPLATVGLPAAGAGTAAGYFRIVDRDGNAVLQGNVATSASDLVVNTTTISENVSFEILSGTVTMPSGE